MCIATDTSTLFYNSTTKYMFSFFKKDPASKLQKQYNEMLEKAMNAQRSGDIKLYAHLSAEAETIWKKIEALKKDPK